MSPEQHTLILKCLGLDKRKSPDRNAIVTGDGHVHHDDVKSLVKAGYLYEGAKVPGGLVYYHATEAGIAVAKLTYEDFLAVQAAILNDYAGKVILDKPLFEASDLDDDGELTPVVHDPLGYEE